ncbi:MAG TPA: hypothetical protein VIM33_09620 [Gaiellaceae bacterium]|jgi:tetratricopeptide (TPR) repeat protein
MATATTLTDVAGLWKLALVLTALLLAGYFRHEVRLILQRGFRLRRGDTELESLPVERPPEALSPSPETEEQEPPDESQEDVVPADEAAGGPPTMRAVFDAVIARNLDEARERLQRVQATVDDNVERLRNEVSYAAIRASFSDDQTALGDLDALAAKPEVRWTALNNLGFALMRTGLPDRALTKYEAAAAAAADDDEVSLSVVGQARALRALGRHSEAVQRMSEALARVADSEAKQRIYAALADAYEETGDWFKRALALSKNVELAPNDSNLKFRVGYAYAQAGLEDLALLHYRASLDITDDPSTLNNVGVEYDRLDLHSRAISSYRRAAELGNSLADANLALKQMFAGFTSEARDVLTKASHQDRPHENVGANIARLSELEEAEAEKERSVLARAKVKDSFLRGYATSTMEQSEVSLAGNWTFADGIAATIQHQGESVTILWNQGTAQHRLVGTVTNAALELRHEVEEQRVSGPTWREQSTALAYAPDGDTLKILLDPNGEAPEQRELSQVSA